MTSPPEPLQASGPFDHPVFSYGFRTFFLLAGIYAVFAMGAWLVWIGLHAIQVQVPTTSTVLAPHVWHAHEMLFGYTTAVIAGFFLTAVPNWTGREALRGGWLAGLAAVWLAGRIAVCASAHMPAALVAVIDLAFVPCLAVFVAHELIAGKSKRNMALLPVFALLLGANLLVHGEAMGFTEGTAQIGHTLALDTVVLLIAVIGGRIVPAFTTNALLQKGETRLPLSTKSVDLASIASVATLLALDAGEAPGWAIGLVAIAAFALHGYRLSRWQGWRTLDQPIVWVLHLAYGWLVVGLGVKGFALTIGSPLDVAAQHALSIGAIGSMTLAIMSRAALGHTGRKLMVTRSVAAAYLCISAAAVIRVLGPVILPDFYDQALLLSGVLWITAFALFVSVYWPILTRPGIRREPQA